MNNFIGNLNWLESVFLFCAIFSTVFFVIRIIMLFVAGDIQDGAGVEVDSADISGDDFQAGDSSGAAFDIISINTLTAFFMMFGWSGLTCYKQYGLNSFLSILISILVGLSAMFITAYLFKLAHKLTSSGDSYSIEMTVGKNAQVYQKIFADGRGKVQLTVNGLTRELEAISADNQEIESFKTVRIVEVIDSHTVKVEQIKK